jgi:hypothetical protein
MLKNEVRIMSEEEKEITNMILDKKFIVDALSRKVTCVVCGKKCWSVIHPDHFAFRCVWPDCVNRKILYLAPNFFQKVIENLSKSATPEELDLSKPIRTRLTKKFFLSLPARVFIMSNIFDGPAQPTYFKPVVPAAEREKQWKEIVLRACDRRICTVFKNKKEAMTYLTALYKRISTTKPPQEQGPKLTPDQKYETFGHEFWERLGHLANDKDYPPWEDWEKTKDQEPQEKE